jgi:hypothetical protein
MTNFDQWLDLNPPLKVYTKYENNPFTIVVCSLREAKRFGGHCDAGQDQNQSIHDFVRGYNHTKTVMSIFLNI